MTGYNRTLDRYPIRLDSTKAGSDINVTGFVSNWTGCDWICSKNNQSGVY